MKTISRVWKHLSLRQRHYFLSPFSMNYPLKR